MPSARKVLLWAGGLSVVLLLIKLIFDQLAPHDGSGDDSQHYHAPRRPIQSTTTPTSTHSSSRQSAPATPDRSFEMITLPLGKHGHAVYAEVVEDDVAESVASSDSWQVVGGTGDNGADAAGAAPTQNDPQAMAARMAMMLERKAQAHSGDPTVVHPSTHTYRKVENWADVGDPREEAFSVATQSPVFYGAEWAPVSTSGRPSPPQPPAARSWFSYG